MRSFLLAVVMLACACPGPSNTDGGTGGSGGSSGGSTAGGSGGSSGGTAGSGGSTAGGTGGSTAGGAGGGTAGGSPVDAGSVALTDLCTQYLDAICSFYVYCGAFENKATCLSVNTARFNPWFDAACLLDEKAAVSGGRLTYDPRAAASCLYQLRTATSCLSTNYPECQNIWHGQVTDGGCARSIECSAPNQYCDSSLAMCPGNCQARKPGGADAGADEECQDGYYAYQGHCRLYAITGLSCAPVATGAPRQTCRPGEALCNPANDTCTALGSAGAVCSDDNQCAFPNRCFGNRCGLPSGLGQLCGYGVPGGPAQGCKFDLACEGGLRADGGSCRALFGLDAGCVSFFECAGNTVCPGVQFGALPDGGFVTWGNCQPPLPVGSTCVGEVLVCDLGTAYCNGDAGCALRRTVGTGGACTIADQCTPPETCVAGLCRRPLCVLP